MYVFKKMATPVGELTLIASDRGMAAVLWEVEREGRVAVRGEREDASHSIIAQAETQLREYFDGKRRVFDLPLAPAGTAFQQKVWAKLREIPFGETWSYGRLARAVGNAAASRAVGAANGRNPLSIIVPCHRVIGASGKLTGFAGGMSVKEKLLTLEKAGGLWT
jgi:methylated-DNA-[protein]-cysteine S-methyltransferase